MAHAKVGPVNLRPAQQKFWSITGLYVINNMNEVNYVIVSISAPEKLANNYFVNAISASEKPGISASDSTVLNTSLFFSPFN